MPTTVDIQYDQVDSIKIPGSTFVFAFDRKAGDHSYDFIVANGGEVRGSTVKDTDYFIASNAGEPQLSYFYQKSTDKYLRAVELKNQGKNIKIISEAHVLAQMSAFSKLLQKEKIWMGMAYIRGLIRPEPKMEKSLQTFLDKTVSTDPSFAELRAQGIDTEVYRKDLGDTGSAYSVGDVIKFGKWPQTTDEPEEIEWKVLSVQDNRMLIISKMTLEDRFEGDYPDWAPVDYNEVREWMNGPFYNGAFDPQEKAKIRRSLVKADWNSKDTGGAGVDTDDYVFLLSLKEAAKYFSSDADRVAYVTAYAKKKFEEIRKRKFFEKKEACWILRTPRLIHDLAMVEYQGTIIKSDKYVPSGYYNGILSIRPAMWIDI